ncbi:hypothetical protein [Pedomonas mirosovicensis]|uniref:hypothetical protein n=1 Tax=Pedomonas mirosovicensis TaxID=2908641 RepID=UPI002168E91B|nr:hypothetical protein [Pedomonas mirosovicensis]MCH8685626.1 hypothetical protein [Pedomonas mirosovicensis]
MSDSVKPSSAPSMGRFSRQATSTASSIGHEKARAVALAISSLAQMPCTNSSAPSAAAKAPIPVVRMKR